jgi:tellurite resistance protein TehA-like permease
MPMARGLTHIKTLPPVYFALVMATGIVSIAAHLHGFGLVAKLLLGLNVVQYAVLSLFLLVRLTRFWPDCLADLGDHLRGPGFFTVVAGTGVLCSQFYVVADLPAIGRALGLLAMILWPLFLYSVFALLIIKTDPPPIEKGINGGWLVSIVATQSVSLVTVFMAKSGGDSSAPLLLFGLGTWCFGIMLYVWVISLIFYRYMFFAMRPGDLSPPYWINMGAVAISTLAGCNLIGASASSPLLIELLPFLKGLTFLLWSTATWWIPMLVILGFWRHVLQRFPVKYDPLYWGMVFPLGMYSACTFRLAQELGLPMVFPIARIFLFLSLLVWMVVFIGLIKRLASNLAAKSVEPGTAAIGGGPSR